MSLHVVTSLVGVRLCGCPNDVRLHVRNLFILIYNQLYPITCDKKMLETLVTTVERYVERHHLLPDEGEIIVAVSGGADLLRLLHVLQRLCGANSDRRFPSVNLHVAHLNHGLRGEAGARDAAYVAQIAAAGGCLARLGKSMCRCWHARSGARWKTRRV